ncbi:hypothetical protein COBT_001247 [Conglomerata obtusa]
MILLSNQSFLSNQHSNQQQIFNLYLESNALNYRNNQQYNNQNIGFYLTHAINKDYKMQRRVRSTEKESEHEYSDTTSGDIYGTMVWCNKDYAQHLYEQIQNEIPGLSNLTVDNIQKPKNGMLIEIIRIQKIIKLKNEIDYYEKIINVILKEINELSRFMIGKSSAHNLEASSILKTLSNRYLTLINDVVVEKIKLNNVIDEQKKFMKKS